MTLYEEYDQMATTILPSKFLLVYYSIHMVSNIIQQIIDKYMFWYLTFPNNINVYLPPY